LVPGWLIGQGIITLPVDLPAFVNLHTVWMQEMINAVTGGLRGNWFLFLILPLTVRLQNPNEWFTAR
jgi:hypothetical protein